MLSVSDRLFGFLKIFFLPGKERVSQRDHNDLGREHNRTTSLPFPFLRVILRECMEKIKHLFHFYFVFHFVFSTVTSFSVFFFYFQILGGFRFLTCRRRQEEREREKVRHNSLNITLTQSFPCLALSFSRNVQTLSQSWFVPETWQGKGSPA